MNKNEIIVTCPCCSTKLYIDKETGGILKYQVPDKEQKSLENLLSNHKKHTAGLGNAFSQAFEEEKKRKALLDKKLKLSMEDFKNSEDDQNS
jgi:hypothetical protein